jgi:hypothetical protein
VVGEDGSVGGFEALPFGLLVFVAGSLLLANAWAVVDADLATSAAAREAVRAFVEAPPAEDARARGEEAAIAALVAHGKRAERATVEWSAAVPERCAPVTVTVGYRVPSLSVPWIGAFGGGVIEARSSHTEVVDPWRAGLPTDGFDARACAP